MGFLNRVQNWLHGTGAKVYNGIKKGVSTGYNAVQTIGHKIGEVANKIDHVLDQAQKIPLVGEVAQAIRGNPLYNSVKTSIHEGVETLDRIDKPIREVASKVDKVAMNLTGQG